MATIGRGVFKPLVILLFAIPVLTGGDCYAQPQGLATSELLSGAEVAAGEAAATDTSAPPLPVCSVVAVDVPDDGGGMIRVSWEHPKGGGLPLEEAVAQSPGLLEVFRYVAGEEPESLGEIPATDTEFLDETAENGVPYQYFVRSLSPAGSVDSEPCVAAVASAQWFAMGRLFILIVTVLFSAAVLFFVQKAKGGAELFIRKIPGLEAVDDAVGRATEMGRPVLYVPGIETVSEVGTLAALTILGHVARRVAVHGTPLEVPVADPIVMTTAQEIVKNAYTEVGQPDLYDQSKVAYLTYDQFGYTAGVDGIMVRERPEAVFLLGTFYAESLILAETGHAIGAIQIAGTKETSQLPFFVAACDYTLIGEELFAASSYLSREPVMLGSLKGQDLAKIVFVYAIAALFVVGTIGVLAFPEGNSVFTRLFDAVYSWFG
jgi:hypothetical protein